MQKPITKATLSKSINTLIGMIEGIAVDSAINSTEVDFLNMWLDEHKEVLGRHPFNEIAPVLQQAANDQLLTVDQKDDLMWLCEKLTSTEFFDEVTAGIQRLHALIGAIASDGIVTEDEVRGLRTWLNDHDYLKTVWPYDEIDSLITHVLADQQVSADEQKLLQRYFMEFTALLDDRTITNPPEQKGLSVAGLCASCPDIEFGGKVFTLTGESSKYKRAELVAVIENLGAAFSANVTKKTNYLIIGAEGNPSWSYACYGRKVEKAIELRKQGLPLVIAHENDLHDAIAER